MESSRKEQRRGWVGFNVGMAHRITVGFNVGMAQTSRLYLLTWT